MQNFEILSNVISLFAKNSLTYHSGTTVKDKKERLIVQ